MEIGRGRVLVEGSSIALLNLGGRLGEVLSAAEQLALMGWSATVADARFMKPLDEELIRQLVSNHRILITVEEGSVGGFGSRLSHFLTSSGLLDNDIVFRAMCLPDEFVEQDSPDEQYSYAGLMRENILDLALTLLDPKADSGVISRTKSA